MIDFELSKIRVVRPNLPKTGFETRPNELVIRVLEMLGADWRVDDTSAKSRVVEEFSRGRAMVLAGGVGPSVVSHPAYIGSEWRNAIWLDLYDDWSIAPDVSRFVRALAWRGYRRVGNVGSETLVTANTPYMAAKSRNIGALVVPNGVREEVGAWEQEADDKARIIMVGHFFNGRTDWRLMESVACSRCVDEVVIYGSGDQVDALVGRARRRGGNVVRKDPTPMKEIVRESGSRTALVVPHTVTDYTLSQDPMKVYQALGAGIPVLMPNQLWPNSIDRALGLVLERGTSLDALLRAACRWDRLQGPDRLKFVGEHSWRRRAEAVVERLKD